MIVSKGRVLVRGHTALGGLGRPLLGETRVLCRAGGLLRRRALGRPLLDRHRIATVACHPLCALAQLPDPVSYLQRACAGALNRIGRHSHRCFIHVRPSPGYADTGLHRRLHGGAASRKHPTAGGQRGRQAADAWIAKRRTRGYTARISPCGYGRISPCGYAKRTCRTRTSCGVAGRIRLRQSSPRNAPGA